MSFYCPTCGKDTRVTMTYWENRGLTNPERRRECPDGHRCTTIEVEKFQYKDQLQDLEYLFHLKTAIGPILENFSKELHEHAHGKPFPITVAPIPPVVLPWFQHNT